jgi:hypothetical protein
MRMVRTKEQQIVADQMFDKLRDDLLSRDLSNTENYDKAILTLSSSSLALSLTVLKFIVPFSTAIYTLLLKSAWVLLAVSVICSLCAYLISNKAMAIQLNNARDYYKNGIEDAFSRKTIFTTINSYLNLLTGLTFSVAICFLIAFITYNINTGATTMTDKKFTNVDLTKSANIPNMESVNTTLDNVGNSANIPTMEQAPSTTPTSGGGDSGSSDSKE